MESSREEVVARYREAGDGHQADATSGRAVFEHTCAVCHALDGIGKAIGPDLRALTDKSPEALLTAILDPNRAIEDKYTTYVLKLRDGSARAGMVASETSTSLVLTLPDGSSEAILRSDLESIESTGRSLMLEGLEAAIKPGEMHDLIAWISQSRATPRSFPGNRPETITAGDDGVFDLTASRAEIFGEKIVFEEKYENLGFWSGENDHAVWTIDCQQPGRFQVELDFACADAVAGNRFRFGKITGTVSATGSWDKYQRKAIGEIEVTPGINRISFGPAGAVKGFLLDLRSLVLSPVQK